MLKRLIKFLLLLIILAAVGFYGYNAVRNREISINQWFVGGYQKGVDVSSYQENVNMTKLKEQGVEFVYIKATEGSSHIDRSFLEKWADAQAAGLPAGAYHYFSYGESGASQAQNFIDTVGVLDGRLIPAVDMELDEKEVYNPPEKEDVVRSLKAFMAVVEEAYGMKPLIYAQKDYYEKYLADDFADYPRWVRNVFYPAPVNFGQDWVLWQYDDKAVLDGYGGEKYIDMDVVNDKYGLDSLKIK